MKCTNAPILPHPLLVVSMSRIFENLQKKKKKKKKVFTYWKHVWLFLIAQYHVIFIIRFSEYMMMNVYRVYKQN